MPLQISTELAGEAATFELRGKLTGASAHELVRRIEQARADGVRDLVVDLSWVDEVDSAGLSRLLWCVRRAEVHGHVQLLARRSQVRRLLSTSEHADLLTAPSSGHGVPRPRRRTHTPA
ncbi:STAS domain-containing protein [Nocardioides ferulae]|uniref:STAS domain-containing protein n=1 Tax=Nocardioides ferulae TaxID=2340821 RepID=UPI000EB0A405|nr:STAS domain-containing protein [Nocardioides ferulae]